MPWIAIVCACLVGACSFDADYSGGTYTCKDGKCPSGLTCSDDEVCVEPPNDGGVDMAFVDAMTDASPPALDCGEPGALTDGQMVEGTTEGRDNLMQSMCGGGFQFGNDAVYRITTAAPNKHLVVTVTGSVSAYVLNTCVPKPNTPACLDNALASSGTQITVGTTTMGDYFVVVDNPSALVSGAYTLRVNVN
jgi:hypothetical protein